MIENLSEGGAVRKEGEILSVPAAYKVKNVTIEGKQRTAVTIPWGDVSTAYYTTGIPNIEVYAVVSRRIIGWMRRMTYLKGVLKLKAVKNVLKKLVEFRSPGPDSGERDTGRSLVQGVAVNRAGKSVEAEVVAPEGYTLTSETALLIADKISRDHVQPGCQTPAGMYGFELILEIDGTSMNKL
jgi:short subunit dehydrogenase-like uncharacterized protein